METKKLIIEEIERIKLLSSMETKKFLVEKIKRIKLSSSSNLPLIGSGINVISLGVLYIIKANINSMSYIGIVLCMVLLIVLIASTVIMTCIPYVQEKKLSRWNPSKKEVEEYFQAHWRSLVSSNATLDEAIKKLQEYKTLLQNWKE